MTTQYIYDLVDTWNDGATTFTSIKMDVTDSTSNAASLLMDLQVGTVSKFKVSKGGAITATGFSNFGSSLTGAGQFIGGAYTSDGASTVGIALSWQTAGTLGVISSGTIGFVSSATDSRGLPDALISRRGTANLRLGAADTTGTTAPTPQFLSAQSWSSSTTNNQTGANFTIDGSQGTGQGAGGSIIFRVAPAGGTSNGVQNALATALTINADRSSTVAANASSLAQIAMADRGTVISAYATAFGTQPLLVAMPGGIQINNDTGGFLLGAVADVRLYRDAANTLALRNGTAAQLFRVYRTTDGTNASWLEMDANANGNAYIGTNKTGTGTAGPLYFLTGGTARWQVNTSGHFTADTDNTYDIGASGANRPRSIYAGTSIISGGASGVISSGYLGSWVFGRIGFSNGATLSPSSTLDTYISRSAAGILAITDAAELTEMTAPAAPAANSVRIYAVDNGSGKTQLMARFATGAAQQIAIEP